MYTNGDRAQLQAAAILAGRYKNAGVHQEIINWMNTEFAVHALDFFCETREIPGGEKQQLIHVILASPADVQRMQAAKAQTESIQARFLNYFRTLDPQLVKNDILKKDFFSPENGFTPAIVITYRPLKPVHNDILNEVLRDEKMALLDTFENVWTLSQTVVFFHTDLQLKDNLANGTSEKITKALEQLDAKYGVKSSYAYAFDSKETFDRDSKGNWYYYWK